MPVARENLIDLNATPYYHVYTRCVQSCFLLGRDKTTGQDFSHRRALIEERLAILAEMFTIDVAAFALLENHMHGVVKINAKDADALDDADVVARWGRLYEIPKHVELFVLTNEVHGNDPKGWINERRERLKSLSWFMRNLKEYIARLANKETGRKGHFWESRFQSNALTTDKAVLTAMAYVDLNPVRAGTAKTPEASEYTSVRQRCRERAGKGSGRVGLQNWISQL